jgi:predicted  nucleic acid-binding Zn-ribbon protein
MGNSDNASKGFDKTATVLSSSVALILASASYILSRAANEGSDVNAVVATAVAPIKERLSKDDEYIRQLRIDVVSIRTRSDEVNANIAKQLNEINVKLTALAPKVYTDRELVGLVEEKSLVLKEMREKLSVILTKEDLVGLRREINALQGTLNILAAQKGALAPAPTHNH